MTGVLPFYIFSLSSQSFTHMDAHSSQSFTSTSQGRTNKTISLSIDHAEEVIDALQWVIDDWDNMDADERETHQGYYDTYHSILKQLAVELELREHREMDTQAEIDDDEILLEEHYNRKAGIYPEPEGCPSY